MLGGTWALANCSPTKNSKCASWVESNSGADARWSCLKVPPLNRVWMTATWRKKMLHPIRTLVAPNCVNLQELVRAQHWAV